jgi:hypothetical protein
MTMALGTSGPKEGAVGKEKCESNPIRNKTAMPGLTEACIYLKRNNFQ